VAGVVAAGGGGVLLVTDAGLLPKYQKPTATKMIMATMIAIDFVSIGVPHFSKHEG
jgi:hypothetical protein